MKTKLQICILAALLVCQVKNVSSAEAKEQPPATPAGSATASTRESQPPVQEDLGFDIVAGKTNKIVRVYCASPAWVYVIYEGGTGGRKIPRQDLPPELKAKYPYDPLKAEDYQKRQAAAAAQQLALAAQQAAKARERLGDVENARLLAQEQAVQQEIEIRQYQDVELTKIIERLENLGRWKAAARPKEARQIVRDRMVELKAQREQIQAQRDTLPKSKETSAAEIAKLRKRDAELQTEIENLKSLPGGHGRLSKASELEAEQRALRHRLEEMCRHR